ncbi:hypothetical protein [Mucilaginibacter celer]|uniref:Uncharacterized protein n=1 Tax=Mucilaginibacter celer TaxID=2305508 RepID=A0A494VJ33_9SPHI|nr:hypothetical protein [Mucilaginibacter celer]AYL94254.1 hypothetical protein HYN43_002620 [Mucilaginibacter celer]
MSNLQKFDDTISEFTKEVGKLKDVSLAYQKIKELTINYGQIAKQFDANSQELGEINALFARQHEKLNEHIADLIEVQKKGRQEFNKLFTEKIELIRKDNKSFYTDLESTVKIKLDDNKSQIKQLIEHERSRIKEIFELEFARNTQELKKLIQSQSEEQIRKLIAGQNVIKYSVWAVMGLISVVILLIILKIPA